MMKITAILAGIITQLPRLLCHISCHLMDALCACVHFPICFISLQTSFFFTPEHNNCHKTSTIGYDMPIGRLNDTGMSTNN